MRRITRQISKTVLGALACAGLALAPQLAAAEELEKAFDRAFGTAPAVSHEAPAPSHGSTLELQLAAAANAARGRIGVSALDLSSGRTVAVLGDQPFPLASTGKVAIVATFLEGVDQGRFHLYDEFPLMIPVPSRKLAGRVAPVRAGSMLTAQQLIEAALTRSNNYATDALLAAIGGPQAVDRWLRRAGISGMRLDRDIATLVRDDGLVNPATTIDRRDSTTPQAMVRLLSGIYRGEWLSPPSREVLLGAMSRCQTGVRRMRAQLPEEALVGHKTGTLANTSSDVGIIRTPDGRLIALAIYVTGQGSKPLREHRIATIARTIYEGYQGGDRQPADLALSRAASR